jgi:branched-subunit amino acid transport protein AzlD
MVFEDIFSKKKNFVIPATRRLVMQTTLLDFIYRERKTSILLETLIFMLLIQKVHQIIFKFFIYHDH